MKHGKMAAQVTFLYLLILQYIGGEMVKTVKLGDGEAQLLEEVRARILRHGTALIENLPVTCPKCESVIPDAKITAENWKCGKCGYSQKGISIGQTITKGAVVGAALVALLWWLSRSEGR
jgi:ribosomal protein S27AE